jgi:hypothetical protein
MFFFPAPWPASFLRISVEGSWDLHPGPDKVLRDHQHNGCQEGEVLCPLKLCSGDLFFREQPDAARPCGRIVKR